MKTMKMKMMKSSIGVLALVFAASFLLLLPGCQGPTRPQVNRTSTVSLTIGQLDMGRAIQPDKVLDDFTSFTATFAHATYADVPVNFAAGETEANVELYHGNWELTVRAYINTVLAATYHRAVVEVGADFYAVTATLTPIPTGGLGTFSWNLDVPTGTTGSLAIMTVDADGDIVMPPIDESLDSLLWEDDLELDAGTYFVQFRLEHDEHGVAFLNSDLHIYQGMISHVARRFEADHFSPNEGPTVIANAAIGVTAPATGAVPNTTATVGEGANFTAGAVTWTPADSPFESETEYTATVTLTANLGHIFADPLATATINGQTAGVTNNIDGTVTLTLAFPATDPPTIIANAAVTVTAPATGAVPNTTATVGEGANFTAGVVTWTPVGNPFEVDTEYTATVTLTANAGHTFTGLTAATINGQAATVTNNIGTTVTLAHTFAATVDPVIVAWEFTGNTSVGNAIVGPENITVQPSGGQQQNDALLQFLTQSGSDLTPRMLSGASSGINVLNTATPPASGGLDGLANNAWWQTYVSTVGRTDIAVTWQMRSTGTGPRDWRLQYRVGSTGGWNNVGGTIALPSVIPGNALLALEQGRFLPTSAEGHDRLYLRWLMTSNVAPNGDLVQSGGTHQINTLVIRSNADPIDNQDDPPPQSESGTFTINWPGFTNPLLADTVEITKNEATGIISISPAGVFTHIEWLDDNFEVLSNTSTLEPGVDGHRPLVTLRVRTNGSNRTYSIAFDTVAGKVFN